MQELHDIDKKGGDEKAWQKSFVRACNHAAMRRVQKSKHAANSDDEADDCAQSVGTRSALGRQSMILIGCLDGRDQGCCETQIRCFLMIKCSQGAPGLVPTDTTSLSMGTAVS